MNGLKVLVLLGALIVSGQAVADGEAFLPKRTTSYNSGSDGLENASGEKLATAAGHYARSRSLLIAAVNEFDKAYKIANPDAILDSKMWRETLIDRAEELQKVLDPQPRVTRGGVRFEGDSRLLNEAGK